MAMFEPTDTRAAATATFPGGCVVQLITGDPTTPDALVASLHPATIVLTDTKVSAVEGDVEWSWDINDLQDVHHSPVEEWSILAVPGVLDHGVAVAPHQKAEFRRRLDRLRGGAVDEVLHLDDPPPAPPAPAPVEPPAAPDLDLRRLDDLDVDLGPGFDLDDDPSLPAAVRPDLDLGDLTVTDLDVPRAAVATPAPAPVQAAGRVRRGRRRAIAGPDAVVSAPPLATLDARSISAWFGTHHVLDRVSLTMHAGQVTALIGPSGCGKSTFLRILNRMHELIPSASLAGEVVLDGDDIYDISRKLTDARRQIGMVFQKPNPFPAMSIYDNVVASFQLTGTKVSASDKDDVVESCLSKAGLWNEVRDRLRQPGGGLSGGQQQRLCIARALAIRPRVLLMDEPCSALDPTSTRRIEQTIVELRSEVTIVIVTHNMQQAARVSDQCAFFLAEAGTPGVIIEHGATEAMFHSPRDERTTAYVNGRFG